MKNVEAILAEIKRLEDEQRALLEDLSDAEKAQLLKSMDDYLYEKHLQNDSKEPKA